MIEKIGIGKEAAAFRIEQIADDAASCFLISLRSHEHGAAVIGTDLPFAQGAKDALTAGLNVPNSFHTRSCRS
jgi:hypothetical protein